MPRVQWGINSSDVDDFDRSSQYTPYSGPVPPNAVYEWQLKVLKYVAGTKEKLPQLRIGTELIPREDVPDESRYEGFFCMTFISISDKTAFRYVPFLDAIGVSGREFTQRTITDEEGNVKKIGQWRNDGETYLRGQLVDKDDGKGGTTKQLGWMGALADEEEPDDADDEEYADDEEPF